MLIADPRMFPVSSTTVVGGTLQFHPQIIFCGGIRGPASLQSTCEGKYLQEACLISGISNASHSRSGSINPRRYSTNCLPTERCNSLTTIGNQHFTHMDLNDHNTIRSPYPVGDSHLETLQKHNSASITDKLYSLAASVEPTESTSGSGLAYESEYGYTNMLTNKNPEGYPFEVLSSESYTDTMGGGEKLDVRSLSLEDGNKIPPQSTIVKPITDIRPVSGVAGDSIHDLTEKVEQFVFDIRESIDNSVNKANTTLKEAYDGVTTSVTNIVQGATESMSSSVNKTELQATSSVKNLSDGFSDSVSKASDFAITLLRKGILVTEESLSNAGTTFVYYYGTLKQTLPAEVQTAIDSTESSAREIYKPIETASREVYLAIEALERELGLDPTDPVVPFALFVFVSASIGISYWLFMYGGYSGDLSPKLALEVVVGDKDAALIDIRPEDLRERDGIPFLRRAARFRYASIAPPEIDDPVKKLLKKDINDILLATIIRNLKLIQDASKVIIMDADGSTSKSIARYLRELGIKRVYLVSGGFRGWVENDLRIKDLKAETALTVLNEETEAILEEIKPTPGKLILTSLGIAAASYAISEWEKTLQLIGIVGLGQTLYRRFTSYEDAEDFKSDVRLLLSPVRLGAQAFAWTAKKLEPNRLGLATSPSTSSVQNRVLQAAAKHESLPSEIDDPQISTTLQGDATQ